MKHKPLLDIGQFWLYTLKLLLRGKETLTVLAIGFVLLLAMLFAMDEVKEEKSKIAVGIVDEDHSLLSERLTERVKTVELYEIYEGEKSELIAQVAKGELSVVCVIRKGYEEAVSQGKTKDLFLLHQTEDGGFLFSDVFAGIMMQDICDAKGYLLYAEYMEKKNGAVTESLDDYRAYVAECVGEDTFDFSFDIQYVAKDADRKATEAPGNEIIYVQAIFAIMALMLGFLAIYTTMPYHRLMHGKLAVKLHSVPVGKSAVVLGSALGSLTLQIIFAVAFLSVFTVKNQLGPETGILFLVCTCAYSCVIVGGILLGGTVISSETVYRISMLALVFVFGIFGLVSIIDGLLVPEGMGTWVPNGWYVREMTGLYR